MSENDDILHLGDSLRFDINFEYSGDSQVCNYIYKCCIIILYTLYFLILFYIVLYR